VDDQVLGVLRFGLLGLLYLFFGRVMWAVWSQVRTAPGPAQTRARRVNVIEPAERAGELDLSKGPVDIGRHPRCAVALPNDAFLSQRHCRVGRDDGGVWLRDLESTNGTFVDGRRITNTEPLNQGARITAGSVVLEAR
jgi:pSer/pThr/pTyr-binding forkhead associated (FHA) protein